MRLAEQNILSRDKVINELRLQLPATADREKLIAELNRTELEPKSHHTMKIAHQTIANMQARLNHKEEVLKKYQHLLEKAREVACHAAFLAVFSVKSRSYFLLKW